jgi:hypothetical protein
MTAPPRPQGATAAMLRQARLWQAALLVVLPLAPPPHLRGRRPMPRLQQVPDGFLDPGGPVRPASRHSLNVAES